MSHRIDASTRRDVRRRAEHRCEYCRKPDEVSLYHPHVDHIIPPMHGGTDDFSNLAWACFQCNVAKGSNIASYDDVTGALTPLYNPRTQTWGDHFELHDSNIVGKTPVGRVTVRVLQFNSDEQTIMRKRVIAAGRWQE